MPEADTMLGLSKPLRKLVVDKFSTACKHNNVQFSETRVALLRSQGAAPVSAFALVFRNPRIRLTYTHQVSIKILSSAGQKDQRG